MPTLQELFDFYLGTKPTEWKLKNASNLLIHACQALEVNCAEEIDENLLANLPDALDRYYQSSPQKAIHEKGTLAEMIGRFGPINGLESVFNRLLNDSNKNLQQFTLQSLEYYAQAHFKNVLPLFEHYRVHSDHLMKQVSAIMLARLSSLEIWTEDIKNLMRDWFNLGDAEYVQMIFEEVCRQASNSVDSWDRKQRYLQIQQWMIAHFEFLK